MTRTYLAVPFAEKDRAKYAGARWDNDRRAWYVDATQDLTAFRTWLPALDTRITVRSKGYFIAHGVERCWQCRKLTLVTGFLLPAGFEQLVSGRVEPGSWTHLNGPVFVSPIMHLADDVLRKARSVGARLRLMQGKAGDASWLNCCEHCNGPQDNAALFGEPGGAFHSSSPQKAALIRLRWKPGPFGAAAGVNPAGFFEAMGRIEG